MRTRRACERHTGRTGERARATPRLTPAMGSRRPHRASVWACEGVEIRVGGRGARPGAQRRARVLLPHSPPPLSRSLSLPLTGIPRHPRHRHGLQHGGADRQQSICQRGRGPGEQRRGERAESALPSTATLGAPFKTRSQNPLSLRCLPLHSPRPPSTTTATLATL